jgi:hypothetical protein
MEAFAKCPRASLSVIDWTTTKPNPSAPKAPRAHDLSCLVSSALQNQGFFYISNVEGYSSADLLRACKVNPMIRWTLNGQWLGGS